MERVLGQEVERLAAQSAHDLRRQIPEPLCYEVEAQGLTCQVEVQIIEDKPEYVHVLMSVDDGSLLTSIMPKCRSFIVHTDGRVDK